MLSQITSIEALIRMLTPFPSSYHPGFVNIIDKGYINRVGYTITKLFYLTALFLPLEFYFFLVSSG
jgi:hypothetical protein